MTSATQTRTARRQIDFGDLPPAEWFENPNLPGLTPLTITREGRVMGHLAGWGIPHRGLNGNIYAPRSRTNYARFVNKTAVVAGPDGQPHMIPAANLTMGTKHAPLHAGLSDASDHYDHSGTIIAQVAVYEDAHGIAYSGAVLPDVTPAQIRRALACAGSGDWRRHDPTRSLELCAALLVPCEGFEQAVPRARVASGAPQAIVAAGMVMPRAAAFGRAVDPSWQHPTPDLREMVKNVVRASDQVAAAMTGRPPATEAELDAQIAEGLERRRTSHAPPYDAHPADLVAEQDALLAAIDDTPVLVASLLDALDETPQQVAALLAALDDEQIPPGLGELSADDVDALGRLDRSPRKNWVEEQGGLPDYIDRIANHLHGKGMSISHAIATAVNAAKKMCSTGDLNWPGLQKVNPGSRAQACAAVAQWEAMKKAARGS